MSLPELVGGVSDVNVSEPLGGLENHLRRPFGSCGISIVAFRSQ